MAKQKADGITWCDYTFNPLMGCSKVSPACKNCYAERDMDMRLGKVAWGPNGTRVLTSDANWRKPLKWNREAETPEIPVCGRCGAPASDSMKRCDDCGMGFDWHRPRVFCASLADVFEDWQGPIVNNQGQILWVNESGSWVTDDGLPGFAYRKRHLTMDDVRVRLFQLIDETPNLDWLLLTKRPENIRKMWPEYPYNGCLTGDCPHERADQCSSILDRENVWLGTSVENQEYANIRIPELLKCRDLSPVLFLSCEPLLGPIEFSNVTKRADAVQQLGKKALNGIDWVIAGGESGPHARPSNPNWFRSLRDQCQAAGVAFHFKQWGEFRSPITEQELQFFKDGDGYFGGLGLSGYFENPHGNGVVKVGKKRAGRLLDGRQWNEFPKVTL